MFRFIFLFLLFVISCQRQEINVQSIAIKIKPLYQREIEAWVLNNSEGKTYKTPPTAYPAQLLTSEGWFKGKISLRGDLKKHWVGPRKSYRFKIKKNSFQQMEELDLVLIEDKMFEQELFAYQLSEQFQLLVPKARFIDLTVGARKLGIYLLIERFTEASLEVRGLPAGEIIKESNAWLDQLALQEKSLYQNGFYSRKKYNPLALEPNIYRTTFNNTYSSQAFTHFSGMLKSMKTSLATGQTLNWTDYVDMDQAAGWSALVTLFGGHHAALGDNLRWYFHPYRNQFRPILYDVLPEKLHPKKCLMSDLVNMNPWLRLWKNDSEFLKKYIKNLQHLTRENFLEGLWENFISKHQLRKIPEVTAELKSNWERLQHNRKVIQSALSGSGCIF